MGVYSMGLGDMKVSSSLNQPFDAEILLLDVGNTPLSGIKTSLASVEDFERVGLERSYELSSLTFTIGKNEIGKTVVKVRSEERMSEPFLQILVDLAWADGQVYRAYTILLDPPDYKLSLSKTNIAKPVRRHSIKSAPGVVDRPIYAHVEHNVNDTINNTPDKNAAASETYGPTLANESIWQVAQRYKSSGVSLHQLILAIVGTNPDAFTNGNLNGLITGSRLSIPTPETVAKIPELMAKEEVTAHDDAWAGKLPIEHRLYPPYINGKETKSSIIDESLPSSLYSAPKVMVSAFDSFRVKSLVPSFNFSGQEILSKSALLQSGDKQSHLKTEIDIASQAIESVREVNDSLKEQILALQAENKSLQQKIIARDSELNQLQSQVKLLISRQGVAGQVAQESVQSDESIWPWILIMFGLGGSGCFIYWWFWGRFYNIDDNHISTISMGDDDKVDIKREDESQPSESDIVENKFIPEYEVIEGTPVTVNDNEQVESKEESVITHINSELKSENIEEKPDDEIIEFGDELNSDDSDELDAGELTSSLNDERLDFNSYLRDSMSGESINKHIENDLKKESTDEVIMEFEPYLKKEISDEEDMDLEPEIDLSADFESIDDANEADEDGESYILPEVTNESNQEEDTGFNGLELVLEDDKNSDESSNEPKSKENHDRLKQEKTLDTLLDLGKTYIDMGDFDAAKQSLNEVLSSGNDSQKKKAQSLLDKLE